MIMPGLCGVQRQYTGTAGRIENARVAVYLTYAAAAGHALIDRALYLPRCWAEYRARREQAGVPDEVEFATKPALARQMIARALDAGVSAGWVAGDEVYGADPTLRGVGYVLTVACDQRVHSPALLRAAEIVTALPREGMATPMRRAGLERAPLLRLGVGQHRHRP